MEKSNIFLTVKKTVLLSTFFLFPLFFLPFTQEYFLTAKLYLLAFSSLLLVTITFVEFSVTKRIVFEKRPFDTLLSLFVLAVGISTFLVTPNKIQALFNPYLGLVTVTSLCILYYYASRVIEKKSDIFDILSQSGLVLALIEIVFFFQPFKTAHLPLSLQFLQNPLFTPMGSPYDLSIFLFFIILFQGFKLFYRKDADRKSILDAGIFIVVATGFALALYTYLKPIISGQQAFLFAPYRLSWYGAIETLKTPISALFGVGVENFAALFTRVKDSLYNASPLWQVSSFNLSHSAVLHIFSETGLFGGVTFILILLAMAKRTYHDFKLQNHSIPVVYSVLLVSLIIALVFLPLSLPIFFLAILLIVTYSTPRGDATRVTYNLAEFAPLYIAIMVILLVVLGASSLFLGRFYMAEVFFQKGMQGLSNNNAKELYDNQRKALALNPYNEGFHIGFAQTNLLIGNTITQSKKELTNDQKQSVIQAIQVGISESKAAVALNPYKAIYWENLAGVYRSVLNIAQGADTWTVSAYQKTIALDPQNPSYSFSLGGVFYSLKQYDEAVKAFEQTVILKPDWSNAHYNLAWAYYQTGKYQDGLLQLQAVQSLTDAKKNKADYEQIQKDIAEFKSKIPEAKTDTTEQKDTTKSELSLPQASPSAALSPKVQLPKEASPEAK